MGITNAQLNIAYLHGWGLLQSVIYCLPLGYTHRGDNIRSCNACPPCIAWAKP